MNIRAKSLGEHKILRQNGHFYKLYFSNITLVYKDFCPLYLSKWGFFLKAKYKYLSRLLEKEIFNKYISKAVKYENFNCLY